MGSGYLSTCAKIRNSYLLFDDLKNAFDVRLLCNFVRQRHGYRTLVYIVLISGGVFF